MFRRLSCAGGMSLLLVAGAAGAAFAGRCATGLRSAKPGRFAPVAPLARRAAFREPAPVPVEEPYHEHRTEHFRILWGPRYDLPEQEIPDADWRDPDGDGVPTWVEAIAEALETAYAAEVDLGFPEPFGAETYYLDVYVGNTGLRVYSSEQGGWVEVTVDSTFYAYTEIDAEYDVAYFVFNDDFSLHADDELSVLRATAAHELFHAVQRALGYPWDDEVQVPDSRWRNEMWWFEATATWMEEVVAPDVDDYVTYVRSFLASPDAPLGSPDGLREYGAAIFPGYLWLRYGAQDLWIDVFSNAFEQGLEPALRDALKSQGAPSLEDVVAAFWSLAAHPEDFWPDGALYRTSSAPRLARSTPALPLAFTSSWSTAPARYGANLFRVDAASEAVGVSVNTANPVPVRVALSRGGHETVEIVEGAGESAVVNVPGEGPLYAAVVNVSQAPADLDYSLRVEAAGGGSSSSDSGGCFLNTVLLP